MDVCIGKPVRQSDLFDALLTALAQQMLSVPKFPSRAKAQEPAACTWEVPTFDQITAVATPPPAPLFKPRVLLVEDNEINQMVAGEVLTQAGFEYDVASDEKQAVQAVQQTPYGVVLMDCQMPEMNGLTATNLIRRLEQEHRLAGNPATRLPIIALTANAVNGDRQLCLEAGMDDYLVKPLDPSLLIQTIHRYLDNQTPAASPTALTQVGTSTA